MTHRTWALVAAGSAGATVAGYLGLVTAAVPIDLGIGRRYLTLGPQVVDIRAPRVVVFDIVAAPYLGRQTRAMAEKIQIIERGTTMVLAAHRTPIRGRLAATTVETVRFTRAERVDFRLVRGPVPEVIERFELIETKTGTRLEYHGRLGTDLYSLGAWWGRIVAGKWEQVVASSFATIKTEAERRTQG